MESNQRLIKSNAWLNARLLEKDFEIQNLKAQIHHLDNIIEMGLAEFNEQSRELESLRRSVVINATGAELR